MDGNDPVIKVLDAWMQILGLVSAAEQHDGKMVMVCKLGDELVGVVLKVGSDDSGEMLTARLKYGNYTTGTSCYISPTDTLVDVARMVDKIRAEIKPVIAAAEGDPIDGV